MVTGNGLVAGGEGAGDIGAELEAVYG